MRTGAWGFVRSVALAAGLTFGASAALAQAILVIDIDRVMREAAAAVALRSLETEARRDVRDRLDDLQRDLEREEAELSAMRDALTAAPNATDREEFERRVRAFDQKVRNARSTAQESALAVERRFDEARSTLRAEIDPLIDGLIAERGAVAAFDAADLLRAAPAIDATDALVERLDAILPPEAAIDLLPQPDPPPPRGAQPRP
jgi:Skp family chaperone for outer membrane proteins